MSISGLIRHHQLNVLRVFPFRHFQSLLFLFSFVVTSLTSLTYSPPAHAQIPDINGTYAGQLSGTDVCPSPEPFTSDTILTITQSGATFTFSGEDTFVEDGEVKKDTYSGSGSISGTTISGSFNGITGDGTQTFTGSFSGTIGEDGNSLTI